MIGRFDWDDWGKWSEILAKLYVAVQPVAGCHLVRRRKDAAVSERARTKFEGPLHPANNPTCGEIISGLLDKMNFADGLLHQTIFICQPSQLRAVNPRAQEPVVGKIQIGPAKVDPIDEQRRAQCATGVPWRRGNIQSRKPAVT